MGNDFSREVDLRGSDLIEIHQGLLYTVLEFIFVHSVATMGLVDFIESLPDHDPFPEGGISSLEDKARNILCLFALISYILPADDFAATFIDPQPSDWLSVYLEAASKSKPLLPQDGRFELPYSDRTLLKHMQKETRQRCAQLPIWKTLTSKTERRREGSIACEDVITASAYHLMNGDAKLQAVGRALGLLARLVHHADLENEFQLGNIPPLARRFERTLRKDESQRRELFTLSKLVAAFKAEETRLFSIRLDREVKAHFRRYLWPRWGNPRPRPAQTAIAPSESPVLSPKDTIWHEPPKPKRRNPKALHGKALWKTGDLRALRVIHGTARDRALRQNTFSATWSRTTCGDEQDAYVGLVSAHTAVAVRGSRSPQVDEEAIPTVVALDGLAGEVDSSVNPDEDATLEGILQSPAVTRHTAASEYLSALLNHGVLCEEGRFAEIDDPHRLPDELHRLCRDHTFKAWDEFHSEQHAISATAPQLEEIPSDLPLSEELDFVKLLYLPIAYEMLPGDDQCALLYWILHDREDK